MGNLVFQATLGGQVNLVGPNTASTFNINVPTVNGNMVTTGDTGTVTNTMCATSVYTAPGTIGSGTPNTGAFTTLSATGVATISAGSASAPALTTSGDTNTGMLFPAADTIAWTTGGTERLRLDSSGNLGLGVTPSAWGASFKALDISTFGGVGGTATASFIGSNLYNNGTNWIYKGSAAATLFYQNAGQHIWYNAASGTGGGTVSLTQAMTLDASGYLGIGTTSPSRQFQVSNGTNAVISAINGTREVVINATTAGCNIGAASNDYLTIATNGVERARIDTTGNLLVGTTVTNPSTSGFAVVKATATFTQTDHASGSASGEQYARFSYAGTNIGSITQNGTTAVAYNTTSDYRLKENVQPLTGALSRIAALNPCTYTWKSAPDEIGEGFIAHELAEVCPQAVTGEKDAVNEDGSIKPQSIDTSFLVATLVAAIQELKAEVDALKGTK